MASAVPPINVISPAAPQAGAAPAGLAGQSADTQAFLKLLVAQIRNQNPLSPADGIEFLTQLAQFTQIEQVIGIRQDLRALLERASAPGGAQEPGA